MKFASSILLIVIASSTSCKKNQTNYPAPRIIAHAGVDQTLTLPTDSTVLYGSASTGLIKSFYWMRISGPTSSTILNTNSSKTLVKALVKGVYKFELTVTDKDGFFAKDTVQISVNEPTTNQNPNHSKMANAGPDQTLTLPLDSAYFDGIGSLPNGWSTPAGTFGWTQISGPSQSSISPPTFLDRSPSSGPEHFIVSGYTSHIISCPC